ncbi:helix-turn-helix domain-containing protein [Mammaliicoccus sciuri]|uniref:helix-turn-helix domain-containing protein n=1 Tax=Mammaliicoccus sciuri TaxID=1296 RepID=UPI002DBFA05D|nr:helix-turn-helix transcriptional regulator [Mammaliicoccus sciuri]MEB6292245.1 helix-turn-helix domain-containing protein [Mammaliicoccus sciuri]
MRNDLGKKIKNIRLQNGLTQEEFGDRFLGTKSLVSKWESGRNRPNPERLRKIANFANNTVEELLKDAEEPPHLAVGKRIRSIRLKHGMSMTEYGKLIDNVKSGVVSNWENGKQIPNKLRLKKIAKLGNITVDELLDITNYQELYELEKERNSLLEQEIQLLKEQLNLLNKKDTSTKVSK